jgi:ribose 5-phosphate isomerase RpiB
VRIAVINEVSAVDKNPAILQALEGRGHEILNLGMSDKDQQPQLLYTHTGFLAALLLRLGKVDLVVGGCGTGQGFLNSVMQYPGVFCGHILTPLDAWLFAQINAGNCISLALNQGYGWAGDVNLRFIFDRLFEPPWGGGYPPHRMEPQKQARLTLETIAGAAHREFPEIIARLPRELLAEAMGFPAVRQFLPIEAIPDSDVRSSLQQRIGSRV